MANEREAILTAAEAEFANVGLKNARLDSIAASAGLEPGAVRALFVDKATLLRDLLKEATDPLVGGIAMAVNETADTRELFRKSLKLYDLWLLNHPTIVKILLRCALDDPQSLGELYQQSLLPSEFYEHLEQLIDEDKLRCNNLFLLSLLLDSLIMFPHMIRSAVALMDPEQSMEQITEARLGAVIDLFENGLYSD